MFETMVTFWSITVLILLATAAWGWYVIRLIEMSEASDEVYEDDEPLRVTTEDGKVLEFGKMYELHDKDADVSVHGELVGVDLRYKFLFVFKMYPDEPAWESAWGADGGSRVEFFIPAEKEARYRYFILEDIIW